MSFSPRALGMDVPITRRDFFDGIAVSCVAGSAAPKAPNPPHPFTVSGDTSEALSVAHALRDGRFWAHAGPPVPTGEHHDLVVVGGGRGGRSAAAEWLRRHPRAGVLVLDTHEALGDHAALGDNAAPDDHAALGDRELLAGRAAFDAVMCDAETFGADTLVATDSPGWIDRLPIAWQARRDLRALHEDPPDWFPGVPAEGKQERLAGLTYAEFLREVCGAHPDAERFCRTMSCPDWGYDTRAFGAIDAWGTGYPGFAGLGLSREQPSRYNSPTVRRHWHGPAPAAAVPALDGRVRVRTSSPVVSVRDGARSATVGYFDGHQVCTVEAGAVILACWSAVVPYLVPELPPERRGRCGRRRGCRCWRRPSGCATRWPGGGWAWSGCGGRARTGAPASSRLRTPCGCWPRRAGRSWALRGVRGGQAGADQDAVQHAGAHRQGPARPAARPGRLRPGRGHRGDHGPPVGSRAGARVLPAVARVLP
ncbi:hypothetical protein ACFQ0B_09645 [Nonomuraea thailandensis]